MYCPQKVFPVTTEFGMWVEVDECYMMGSCMIPGQDHRCLKVVKMADFKVCLLRQYACNQKTNEEL